MPIKGFEEAKNKIIRISSDAPRAAESAMIEVLITIGAESASKTPIDTSTLINSMYRHVISTGDAVTGRIGYAASYAKYVHDPKVKQQFRLPRAEKEFLKKAINETRPLNIKTIKRYIDASL